MMINNTPNYPSELSDHLVWPVTDANHLNLIDAIEENRKNLWDDTLDENAKRLYALKTAANYYSLSMYYERIPHFSPQQVENMLDNVRYYLRLAKPPQKVTLKTTIKPKALYEQPLCA